MASNTLTERVATDFARVKLKKASVKVPKLKIQKESGKRALNQRKADAVPISSLVNILIKSAIEKAKKEQKEKVQVEEEKSYTVLKEGNKLIFNGGYGTVSKGYGAAPHASYVDYGKLFSHLGSFRAKQPYENMAEHVGALNRETESRSFVLADKQTMERGAGYVKYFLGGIALNPDSGAHPSSLVPVAGMNSSEWEQFKMWMKLDPVMYLLKIRTS